MKVFTENEVEGRQVVMLEQFVNQIVLEGNCLLNMISTGVVPCALKDHKVGLNNKSLEQFYQNKIDLIGKIIDENNKLQEVVNGLPKEDLNKQADYCQLMIRPALKNVRELCDKLERITDEDVWPFPSYQAMVYDHHTQGESETTL